MSSTVHRRTQVGELVAASFDQAARYRSEPREVTRLAMQTFASIMRLARPGPRHGGRPPSTDPRLKFHAHGWGLQ